jgi:hypothetical protein
MRNELKIVSGKIIHALEDHSDSFDYFLDLKNGNVVPLSKDYREDESEEDPDNSDGYSHQVIETNPGRFLFIDPINSSESFKIMDDFSSTILNDLIKNTLRSALTRRKPFRNFKEELNHLHEIQKEWYNYHEKEMEKTANEWLDDNDIKADLIRK